MNSPVQLDRRRRSFYDLALMVLPKLTALFFAPMRQYVEARLVELTEELAQQISIDWWTDGSLCESFDPVPIDRYWNWKEIGIEYGGKHLTAHKIAIITGDAAVQGAMMMSAEPIPSALAPRASGLFVELLFTAPRNRPALRRDRSPFFVGVGTELLTCAAAISHDRGYDGRLLLDGSPEFVGWYKKRGLQKLKLKPMVFEGVAYTPMELPPAAAKRLLRDW